MGKPAINEDYKKPPDKREFGQDKGLFEIPEDFDAPLPEEVLKAFEGESPEL